MPERWLEAKAAAIGAAEILARELKLTPLFARLLARRGFSDAAAADAFLQTRLDALHDPAGLPDMAQAVARIRLAVEHQEKIVLFGDYDVDGVSSAALMARFFRVLGYAPVTALVPERDSGGYGLSAPAVQRIKAAQPKLLITLDNGTSAHAALEDLAAAKIDAIVVDHHQLPPEGLPRACAVVNPQRNDHAYPFRELCGAGLSFKLAWALAQAFSKSAKVSPAFREFLLDALGFAALGTIADVVPLVGENRILAAQGLRALGRSSAPGVTALLRQAKIEGLPNASDVGFRIGPRLNAAGRCGQAAEALELLLTEDSARAEELAAKLEVLNIERQGIEERILNAARAQALARLSEPDPPRALVLTSADWHVGVIGIVASRIVEEFHRPVLLLALDEAEGVARGSGRSIKGFNLAEALAAGGELLLTHGGHAAAAGLSVASAQIEAFRTTFESVAAERILPEQLHASLEVEAFVPLGEVTSEFCRELERLEPCGMGNPRPVLAARGVRIAGQIAPMGANEQHVSFFAGQNGTVLRAVGFGMGEHFNALCDLSKSEGFEIAFRPQLNTFRGETKVELHLRAFRKTATNESKLE
ncbi:MAG: single-stranded-DNA-specific exonuclease RecJ [Planctomycetes bacterium]|nr:single-stranded-DNA-specific exonuclease RecJ [Planctomycetota bacterium]